MRVGYFLVCAGVALYGGWHWFGSSGLALVALWLEVRLPRELASISGDFSLYLDRVAGVRMDPWRVTVTLSQRHRWPSAAARPSAQSASAGVLRDRIDIFRDELEASQWSELRRRLLVQVSAQRKPVATVTTSAKT